VKSIKQATKFAPQDYNLLVVSDRSCLRAYPGSCGETLLGLAKRVEGAGGNACASRASREAFGKETMSGYSSLLVYLPHSFRFQVSSFSPAEHRTGWMLIA